MKHALAILVVLALVSVLSVSASASVPPMINYQGKLMQPNGTPVPDGECKMTFAVYGQPTGGSALWSEVNEHVQVKGGLYNVLLGSVSPMPTSIFDVSDCFFGVKVGDDPEMTPRQEIASVALAVRAASADTARTVDDGAITSAKIAVDSVTSANMLPHTKRVSVPVWSNSVWLQPGISTFYLNCTGYSTAIGTFSLPSDYAGGDAKLVMLFVQTTETREAARKMVLRSRICYVCEDLTDGCVEHDANADFVQPSDTWWCRIERAIPATQLQAGNTYRFQLDRLGDDPADDQQSRAEFFGAYLEYLGRF